MPREAVALGAGLLGAGAVGAAAVARRRRTTAMEHDHGPREWSCACGQAFRVAGEDRHRLYWLVDAPPPDPVLDGSCPACGRPLPHEHEATTASR
jgi:hypothetical protein